MAEKRQVKVRPVRRRDVDHEQLALTLWIQSKRALREREARERAKKKARDE